MSKIADRQQRYQQTYQQILNLQQNKSEMGYFKEQINEAITELRNAKEHINIAKTELEKVYTGQIAKENGKKLENKIQEINSIKQELENIVEELNQEISSLSYDINVKKSELQKLEYYK